jgi:hypothetical protein
MDKSLSNHLQHLLLAGNHYAPFYRPSLNSDHLPMTLSAMRALGATDVQLDAYRDTYLERLHLWEEGAPVNHWRDGLGKMDAYPSLMQWFRENIDRSGAREVLDECLPVLLPAIPIAAFHPVIRLGYAMDFASTSEVTAALAYLTVEYKPLPVSMAVVDLEDGVRAQAKAGAVSFKSQRFGSAIMELFERGHYPVGTARDIEELARVSMALYQSTRNFFALHLVTASQALRCAVTDETRAIGVASMTGAILASHLVLASPEIAAEPVAVPDSLDTEHALKYVWACLSEYRHYGNEVYLQEANAFRDAGLVPKWVSLE